MMSKTHPAHSRTLRVAMALTTSLTLMSFSATTVYADKRQPAPVVYATPGNTSEPVSSTSANRAAARRSVQHSVRQVPAPVVTNDRRVEFRYPDQPDVFYGQGGARRNASATPLNFSSSISAVPVEEARQYSLAEPSVNVDLSATRDPAINPGGLEAEAVSERRFEATSVTSSPLAPVETAPPPVQPSMFQPVAGGAVYDETGKASIFDPALNGQLTANGEVLDTSAMVAAHPSLPLPSLVQVINPANGKEIVVRVNDRGPFDGGGMIEVSSRAADLLGLTGSGSADVRVRYLGPAPEVTRPVVKVIKPESTFAPPGEEPLFGGPSGSPASAYPPLPVRAPAPRLPVADPGTVEGGYVVQLASFTDIGNAQRMHDQLKSHVNVNITTARVHGADYFRIVTTPLADRHAAEMLRDRLANQGIASGLVITAP